MSNATFTDVGLRYLTCSPVFLFSSCVHGTQVLSIPGYLAKVVKAPGWDDRHVGVLVHQSGVGCELRLLGGWNPWAELKAVTTFATKDLGAASA